MPPTQDEVNTALVRLSDDIREMKGRDARWHEDEVSLLRDIKASSNGTTQFYQRALMFTIVALAILAGAKAALDYLGGLG